MISLSSYYYGRLIIVSMLYINQFVHFNNKNLPSYPLVFLLITHILN